MDSTMQPRRLHPRATNALARLCAVILVAGAIARPAPAAERTGIAISAEAGQARLVFRFPGTFPVRIEGGGSVLVLRFGRPISVAPEPSPGPARGIVSAIRLDPDGGALRLALARPARPHLTQAGPFAVLDLMPPDRAGPAPPLPADILAELVRRAENPVGPAPAAPAPARLTPQVARAAGAMRLVFPAPAGEEAALRRNGEELSLTLGARARLDEAQTRARLAPHLGGLAIEADGASLRFRPPRGLRVEGFAEEGAFVLDLRPGVDRPGEAPAPGPVRAGTEADGEESPPPVAAAPPPPVAAPVPPPPRPSPPREAQMSPAVIRPEAWLAARRPDAERLIRSLRAEAARASGAERAGLRLDLARHLFANGLMPEALAVLAAVAGDEPRLAARREHVVLTAAAQALARRFEAAIETVARRGAGDGQAEIWRALAEAGLGRWREAHARFAAHAGAIDAGPDALRRTLMEAAARAAIEAGDGEGARSWTQALGRLPAEARDSTGLALLEALAEERFGNPEAAGAALARIPANPAPAPAAQAALAGARIELARGAITRAQAIERLQGLAVAWRGDATEARALALLGRLLIEENRWREAFGVARAAARAHPEAQEVRALHEAAAEAFERLFADGRAADLPRIEALALAFDFRAFTPPGARGDLLVGRLAGRLIALDLVAEAADLLRHQIEHRLTGEARAAAGAELAGIELGEGRPLEALRALETTRHSGAARPVQDRRRAIEARCHAALGRVEVALDLAAGLPAPLIDEVSAEILWRAGRWAQAGPALERMLANAPPGEKRLARAQRLTLLRAAIAYGLARDHLSLDRLAGERAKALAGSPEGALIAELAGVSRAALGEAGAPAPDFGRFLAAYREIEAAAPGG
jgi:hypothetical protein